jgi:hypothetical protein
MRFLAENDEKNNGKGKCNRFSRFAFGFAPAFGRAVRPAAWPFFGMPEGVHFRWFLCVCGVSEQTAEIRG